jgi:hypothetical protein
MKNKILLVALGTMATTSIAYGSHSDLYAQNRPQHGGQQASQSNYSLLNGWPAAPQTGQAQLNYYDRQNQAVQPGAHMQQAGQQPVPPGFEPYPALAQVMQQRQQGADTPSAPPMDDETAAQFAQQVAAMDAYAHNEKPHHDDIIKHQAFLPVEMAAGYGMGLLMSDEILGLLQKLGFKKDAKVDLEKLKKRRAWYIPALFLAGYLAHKFGPRSEEKKFVECACDQRGFHEVTRISIFDRLSNAAIGYLIGLIMPHLEGQKSDSKTNTEQEAQAKIRS